MKFKKVDDRRLMLEDLDLNEETINAILEAEDSPEALHTFTSWEDLLDEND